MKHFLTTSDFTQSDLSLILEKATAFKKGNIADKPLQGKSIALVFFNPSLRTRVSMQVAIYELGGNAITLEPGGNSWTLEHREGVVMDTDRTEHLKEFVRVLSRYVSAIGVRTFAKLQNWDEERQDLVLRSFAKYSSVPVINLESAMFHPCQAMADMLTINENYNRQPQKILLTWAWHPKALPMAVPNSFLLAAATFGHDIRVAFPNGYELDENILETAEKLAAESGGRVEFTSDNISCYEGVNVVYAKSWGSKNFYGNPEAESEYRKNLRDQWRVDSSKMAITNNAIFMHCLPVRRNVVVTDEVLDSPRSVIIDEAENRLHVQKAILSEVCG
jgi:N-acetylornithine carbamoyltransferase